MTLGSNERPVEILLVADDPEDVDVTMTILQDAGFSVNIAFARDAQTAMAYLHKEKEFASVPSPDLVLLDLAIPTEDWYQVQSEISQHADFRTMPVIALISTQVLYDLAYGLDIHPSNYSSKPINPAVFARVLRLPKIEQFIKTCDDLISQVEGDRSHGVVWGFLGVCALFGEIGAIALLFILWGPTWWLILAIMVGPEILALGFWIGLSYLRPFFWKLSIRRSDAAIAQNPLDPNAYLQLASTYEALGSPQQAVQAYNEAIRLNPLDTKAHHCRGSMKTELGRAREAIEDYGVVIRLDPQFAQAYASRAMAYVQIIELEKARQDMDRAVELGVDRTFLEEKAKEKAEKLL